MFLNRGQYRLSYHRFRQTYFGISVQSLPFINLSVTNLKQASEIPETLYMV